MTCAYCKTESEHERCPSCGAPRITELTHIGTIKLKDMSEDKIQWLTYAGNNVYYPTAYGLVKVIPE